LYCLLTGQHVLDLGNLPTSRQITAILCDEPIPIRCRQGGIPKLLAAAIHRALDKQPQRRFADVAVFREALLPYTA
jgi:hypothetical protein